jgi:hypothetical protein
MKPSSVAGAISLAALFWCTPLLGQWSVGAEVGADRFWGGSSATTGEHRSFRPYRPTTFGVAFQRKSGRFGLGLRLRYASASLGLEGAEGVIAAKGVFSVYTVSPEVMRHLATVGSVNRLLLHAGPLLEVWTVTDGGSQTRVGVQGALSLCVPLGGRFEGLVTAGAALIPSPFAPDQLADGFERRGLWRRRVGAGLNYRL